MRARELSTLIDMPGKVETKSARLNIGGHNVRWRICGGKGSARNKREYRLRSETL